MDFDRPVKENYKSNSHRSKEEKAKAADKKVDKVITGKARVKKKSGLERLSKSFIAEDASNVKSYILMDVLIPAAKKAISDIVTNGIDMLLYGESRQRNKRGSNVSYVSYDRFADRRDDRSSRYSSRQSRSCLDEDIILDSRDEAEEVLRQLDLLIDTYHVASVSDLYDLIGQTGPYTGNRYGWTNLRNAEAVRLRDGGYLLKMPKALPID